MLPLDVSVLKQPVLPLTFLFYSRQCCRSVSILQQLVLSGGVFSAAPSAILEQSVLKQPVHILNVSVLQQLVLPLVVYGLLQPLLQLNYVVYSSLYFTWTYLFNSILSCTRRFCPTEACAAPGPVYLQEPVWHLYLSVYKSLALLLDVTVSVLHLYVCFCAAPGCVCLQKPVLHLYVSVYHSWADPPKKYPRTPARRVAKLYKEKRDLRDLLHFLIHGVNFHIGIFNPKHC
jgi:hypothetical protein